MKELKVDLFNSKKEKLETSIELSKFNIFIGDDLINVNRIILKARKTGLLTTHTLLGDEDEVTYHKELAYKITKRYYSDDLKDKQVVISTNSQFVLYTFNNLIFNYIVKNKMPAYLRDEMTCKDIMIDPKDIRIYQVENGIVTRIQNKDGLIEHNCFDSEMNIIMNDFYKMIDYYECQ
jgi:hypothetical protein